MTLFECIIITRPINLEREGDAVEKRAVKGPGVRWPGFLVQLCHGVTAMVASQ